MGRAQPRRSQSSTPAPLPVTRTGGAPFPGSLRLLDKKAFQRVFENPSRISGRYFLIFARQNDCRHPRLGLAISKKAIKTAVERNRVKRVCRESFRHHQMELPTMDIVIMVHRSGVANVSNAALFDALSELWLKLVDRCARS